MNTKSWRLGLLVLSGLAFIILSINIYLRATVAELWGYLPLGMLLSAWILLLTIFYRKDFKEIKLDHPLVLSTISGCLLGFGFPGDINIPPLMWIAFLPLLRMEALISHSDHNRKGWQVFRYSYNTFIIWNIISTYWVTNASLGAGIFAVTVNSVLMALVVVLFHHTKKSQPRFEELPLIAFWLMFEYLHYRWDLSWPWLTLGNSWANAPMAVQWYEYTGVLGGSLWLLAINILIFQLGKKLFWGENYLKTLVYSILALVVPVSMSLILFYQPIPEGQNIEVVAIQPGYEPHYKKNEVRPSEQVRHILALAEEQVTKNTDFLVLPEVSLSYFQLQSLSNYPEINTIKQYLNGQNGLSLIGGFGIYSDLGTEKIEGRSIRERKVQDQTIYYEIYNAALQLKGNDEQVDLYRKSKLVPGPEFFPFAGFLSFLKPILKSFGGTTSSLGTEPRPKNFSHKGINIAPVICYESVYGEYLAEFARSGAQAIFIMTNDGWWDNTAGHKQHQLFAQIRAIETRRPIVRAASTGISAFINAKGFTTQQSNYDEAVALKGTIQLSNQFTFYMQWGNMVGRIGLFLGLILLMNAFVKGVIKKES